MYVRGALGIHLLAKGALTCKSLRTTEIEEKKEVVMMLRTGGTRRKKKKRDKGRKTQRKYNLTYHEVQRQTHGVSQDNFHPKLNHHIIKSKNPQCSLIKDPRTSTNLH